MIKINEHSFAKLYKISSGISTTKAQAGHGSPFVSFSTVFNNYFLPDELPDLMSTSAREQETYSVKKGDIFLTRTSETVDELAMSCVALKDYAKATFSGFTKRLRPITEGIVYHKYLGFYLRGYLFRQAVTNHSLMTLRSSFNEDIFALLKLYLPEYEQQMKLGDFLYAIEQKIQLNNRINDELEKVAKLLYDYWFVQFDFPNAEGKPYRQSGGEMVWNEQLKREIPDGWEVGKLSNVAEIIMGSSPIGESINETGDGIAFLQGKTDFGAHFPTIRTFTTKPVRFSKENDILLSVRAPVGSLNIALQNCCIGRGLAAIRGQHQTYLIYLMKALSPNFQRHNKGGTTFGAINKDELAGMKFPLPTIELRKTFDEKLGNATNIMKTNELQNKELESLRDFLLPLLMNGQVTVTKSETVSTPDVAKISDAEEKRRTVFKRLVLSAYILDTICDEPTAGRVKFEKLLYLSEHCAKIPLHSEFRRAAAGPYDSVALYSIENQLKKSKWFKRQKSKDDSRAYTRLENSSGYAPYLDVNFDNEQKSVIDKLLRLFKTERTITCEIVATLYGAWNDFLLESIQPGDDQIVDEVMTNWHESKERIERDRWFKALEWMRQNCIVPTGYGVSTKNSVCKS